MALPNTNISVSMVKSELGAATNDVGRLCIHPNINKWSKWKPVRHSSVVPITEAQLKSTNYGLNLGTPTSSISELKTKIESGTANWNYLKPTGGLHSPYRLSDFANYDKTSVSPIRDFFITPRLALDTASGVMGSVLINPYGDTTNIGFEELNTPYNLFGIALFSGDTLEKMHINPTPGDSNVTLDKSGLSEGNYKAFMFLANNISGDSLVGLDNFPTSLFNVSIVSSDVTITLSPRWINVSGNTGTIVLDVSVTNLTGSSITLNNASAMVRFFNSDFNDPIQSGEGASSIKNEIVSGESRIITYTFTNKNINTSWRLWFNCQGTFARRLWTNIRMPMPGA